MSVQVCVHVFAHVSVYVSGYVYVYVYVYDFAYVFCRVLSVCCCGLVWCGDLVYFHLICVVRCV